MAFTHYRSSVIFLKKENKGEADQLFTVFSQEFGRLKILGRAIRKIKSKLRSGADVFYLSEIEFIQGRNYKTLIDAILTNKFKEITSNQGKLDIVSKIAEAIDSLIRSEQKDEPIWLLLLTTFRRLNNSVGIKDWKLELVYIYFLWTFFSLLGYAPELYNCSVCRKKLLPETLYFVPAEGGVACEKCLNQVDTKEAKEAKIAVVKVLRILFKKNFDVLERLKLTDEDRENLREISEFYLSFLKKLFKRKK